MSFCSRRPPQERRRNIHEHIDELRLDVPIAFKRRGVELKLVITDHGEQPPRPDTNLIRTVAQGWEWFGQIKNGDVRSVRSLWRRLCLDQGDLSRILPLGLLAPDIVEATGANPTAIAAIRLLTLTGCRKSEILTLKWDHVDFERGCLRLPESKTGAKVVPLGSPALELLSKLTRWDGNPYVLPGANGGHFVGLQKVWERIRKSAGLDDVRLHDLRHSFASVAVAGGDSLYLVGKVLGHRQARTTERYAHLSDDPVRAVADRTSEQIAAAMNGATKSD